MQVKMNTEEFIKNARAVHSDRYEYRKTIYTGVKKKIVITCAIHGDFETIPWTHLRGSNCTKCAGKVRLTTEEFVRNAVSVHGDRYDYSRTKYVNRKTKVEIICPDHGEFLQEPGNHVNSKSKCPICTKNFKLTIIDFIERSTEKHGNKYDYSKSEFESAEKKITIICPEHGEFEQIAYAHMLGHGCIPCGIEKCASSSRRTLEEFIKEARNLHGDKYDYSKSSYKNSTTQIEIICQDHGSFWQIPQDHITRYGCSTCAERAPITADQFIERSRAVHGDKYNYENLIYNGFRKPATITCLNHGEFIQDARTHAEGHGCPKCAREATSSAGEKEVADWLESQNIAVIRNDRQVLDGFELDIYIPESRIGIEFNGAYWHHDERLQHPRIHETKALRAGKLGITIISVWDFDWIAKKEFVQQMILHRLGKSKADKFNARDCQIKTITSKESSIFYEKTHIQGKAWRAKVNYGLFIKENLIGCMSFSQAASRRGKTGSDEWELIRYSTAGIVRGGASKLFSHFIKNNSPAVVWSYSDRQHFAGSLYTALNFKNDGELPADYKVYHQNSNTLWHKSAWQRKHIQKRLIELGSKECFDPNTDARTEKEMQALVGVLRIRDSGKIRWKWG